MTGPELPPGLAAKIRAQIQRDTQPVKPLMSVPAYTLLFLAFCGLVSFTYAAVLKLKGLHALSLDAATGLLTSLAVVALAASISVARSMRPAGGRLHTWLLSALALVGYEALVIRLFSDYSAGDFMHSGLVCLSVGVLCGILVAVPIWFIIRRGFVVQPVLTGASIGLVGGLAGLTMLTLHCAILTVPHAAIWHAGVILVCVGGGAIAGRTR